jgi:hypothetical protein
MANYTDLVSAFQYKKLLSSILMQQLAGNDAYNNFTAGTVMSFFQSTPPTGWTQDVSIHDHGLRVVDSAGGGTGGTSGVTSLVAHTHGFQMGAGWPDGVNPAKMNAVIGFAPKYASVHFAAKDADSYSDLTASVPYKTKITFQIMNQLGTNDNSNRFADGTAIPFFQAAAPTGWTKSTALNDCLLRQVNSGTGGGSGGTDSISSPPTHQHLGYSIEAGYTFVQGGALKGRDEPAVAFAPKYVDIILCSKDAHAFTDMSAAFAYKQLVTAAMLNTLAENDENNWIPGGSVTPFFQASAPIGWSKSVANNDAFLRVTSGTGGGTGGTDSISSPPAHYHAYDNTLLGHNEWREGSLNYDMVPGTAFNPKYADVIMCTKNT